MSASDSKAISIGLEPSGVLKAEATNFPNDIFYNMNFEKRGIALIFNHETFGVPADERPASRYDRDALACRLAELGFDVDVNDDYRVKDIQDKLGEVAFDVDHSNHDCLVVAIFTHGTGPGTLLAYDGEYRFEDVWTNFTPDICPSLAGKPKIFITQACRGEKVQNAVEMVQYEHDGNSVLYTIPTHADFLFAHSTIPDYLSFKRGNGSWYIQSLCKELLLNGKTYDFVKLLTFVSRRVAIEFESSCNTPELDGKRQIPCFTSMLTRLIKFSDKKRLKYVYSCK
ncbi:caspase-1-like [Chrysoperla carnea]|uniref:caspase-1-like n=1 Tax=Chrysoperla carnea TaxID=189513 RepID=UPI001D093FDF|nr:caspase-1-like [Chrysoperla carnea]